MLQIAQSTVQSIELFLLCSSLVAVWIILVTYHFCYKNRVSMAFQIIMVLFTNEFIAVGAQLLPYFNRDSQTLCSLSLILSTGFNIVSNFWTIFIARIVYKETTQPGKFINIWRYVTKNIILTYIPSIIICVLISVMLEISNSKDSVQECWRVVTSPDLIDNLVYVLAFIVPNLITVIVNSAYLYKYIRDKPHEQPFNYFLLFPILQLLIGGYYVTIKTYLMFPGNKEFLMSEIVYLCEPLIYGLVFVFLLCRGLRSSDLDLENMSLSNSLIYTSSRDV